MRESREEPQTSKGGGLRYGCREFIHKKVEYWCMIAGMSRTNIEINDQLAQEAQKLTGLQTKRAVVDRALELLVRTEKRKGLLRYYGSGVWKGDLRAMRRNRV